MYIRISVFSTMICVSLELGSYTLGSASITALALWCLWGQRWFAIHGQVCCKGTFVQCTNKPSSVWLSLCPTFYHCLVSRLLLVIWETGGWEGCKVVACFCIVLESVRHAFISLDERWCRLTQIWGDGVCSSRSLSSHFLLRTLWLCHIPV